jgi:23S rRNA (cytosine1962-C5)-methyltransferase
MSQLQKRKGIIIKPGRERSLLRKHPWIFSGAVGGVQGDPAPGETVEVRAAGGEFLAWAAYNPTSQIRARVWSWDADEIIDESFFFRGISTAIAAREELFPLLGLARDASKNALRLVNAESDGLPGLIVDRYTDTLVAQFLTAGMERWREAVTDALVSITGLKRVYERSDVDARGLEGLPERRGSLRGGDPPEKIVIQEAGSGYMLEIEVDVRSGHKTAYYLDQPLNRKRIGEISGGREVLDCFCYTGGFALHAAAGGAASILALDASSSALEAARKNYARNALPEGKVEWMEADVFLALRKFRDSRRTFDLIVLDPPKFAQTASQAERAARGYKDINLLAFKLLRPGGLLVTFSCSGGVSEELFQKIVAGAALDAGVRAQIVERLHQAPDHPVALNFPEASYLKGFIIRIG